MLLLDTVLFQNDGLSRHSTDVRCTVAAVEPATGYAFTLCVSCGCSSLLSASFVFCFIAAASTAAYWLKLHQGSKATTEQ